MVENIQTILSECIENETEKSSKVQYNYCRRCHRKLTSPENKLRGMGKVCWEKSQQEQSRRLFDAKCNT